VRGRKVGEREEDGREEVGGRKVRGREVGGRKVGGRKGEAVVGIHMTAHITLHNYTYVTNGEF